VIPQTLKRFQDRSQIRRRGSDQVSRLIGDSSNLIEVAPYHSEFPYRAL